MFAKNPCEKPKNRDFLRNHSTESELQNKIYDFQTYPGITAVLYSFYHMYTI